MKSSSDQLSFSGLSLSGSIPASQGGQRGGGGASVPSAKGDTSNASKRVHHRSDSRTSKGSVSSRQSSTIITQAPPTERTRNIRRSQRLSDTLAAKTGTDDDLIQAASRLSETASKSKSSRRTPSSIAHSKTNTAYFEGAYPEPDISHDEQNESAVPGTIFTPTTSYGQASKKYHIFIAPESPEVLQDHCFMPMADGSTFCVERNCKVSHRGSGDKVLVAPGEAYIKFSKTRVFKEPSANSILWDEDLYEAWVDTPVTMEEWIHRFALVRNNIDQKPEQPINENTLKKEERFAYALRNLKSVRKRKREHTSPPEPINYTLGYDFGVEPESGYSFELLAQAIASIDKALHGVIANSTRVFEDLESFEDFVRPSLTQSEEALKMLALRLGTKPTTMLSRFNSPTIWSTLSLLANEFENINNRIAYETISKAKQAEENACSTSEQFTNLKHDELDKRIDLLKASLMSVTNSVQKIASSFTNHNQHSTNRSSHPRRNGLEARTTISRQSYSDNSSTDSDLSSVPDDPGIEKYRRKKSQIKEDNDDLLDDPTSKISKLSRLDRLERELILLKASKKEHGVNFGGLHFTTKRDSDAWLSINSPDKFFGLVVDVHAVCEHIYALMFGKESTLTNLHDLAKIKLHTDIEGIQVTSFDRKVPKLFTKSSNFKLIRNDDSYFDQVPAFADWNASDDGFRDTLLARLNEFQEDHSNLLHEDLDISSPLFMIANNALISSVAWLDQWIRYIDDTYKEYTESKFNPKKAWHITTRLARSLMSAIAEPRSGIGRSLRTKKPLQMKQAIFFSTVRSLDTIKRMSHVGFKNSPIVANELVKCLAKNTNVEAIERLKSDLDTLRGENRSLKSQISEITAKANEAGKVANGANNKADQQKNRMDDLAKKIQKLQNP